MVIGGKLQRKNWLYCSDMVEGRYYKVYPRYFRCAAPNLDLIKRAEKFMDAPFRTCGTAALSLITNLHPKRIEPLIPKPRLHWTDNSIRRFLRWKGYKMFPLTKHGVTSLDGVFYKTMPITSNHCILVNSLVCEDEASYFLLHKGLVFHNFMYQELPPLFLINKPSQSVYIIFHPKWGRKVG